MDTPPSFSPEELLASRGWINSLARTLLADSADADDATQDTLIRALQSRGRIRALRPWLVRVLTNLVRKRRRGEARRRLREASLELAEPSPAPADLVQRAAIQSDVLRAVLQLDEPYRSAVLLRYFEERPPAEIALALQISEAAVRQRLKRARDRLRELLASRYASERSSWTAALFALVQAQSPPTPVVASHAPIQHRELPLPRAAALRFAWSAVGVGLVLGTIWLAQSGFERDRSRAMPDGSTGTAALPGESALGDRLFVSERQPHPRESLDAPPAGGSAGSLTVQVRWADDGEPAAEVVVLVRCMANDLPYPDDHVLRTDDEGVARASSLPSGPVRVGLLQGGDDYHWIDIRAAQDESVELELATGITVVGDVVDEHGQGISGAQIWLSECWQSIYGHVVARTDSSGRFRVRGVQLDGLNWLGARANGRTPSSVRAFEGFAAGAEVPVQLVLDRQGGTLHVSVVGAHGEPIAGAELMLGYESTEWARARAGSPPQIVTTDAAGACRIEGTPLGKLPIQVRGRGFAAYRGMVDIAREVRHEIQIALLPEARIVGRVTDASTADVAGAAIYTHEAGGFASASTRSSGGGEFRLRGVAGPTRIRAQKPDGSRAEVELHLAPGEEREWNPVLRPAARIFGVVSDSHGSPVWCRELVLFAGAAAEWDERHALRWGATDESGRFAFDAEADLPHTLLIYGPDMDFASLVERDVRPQLEPLSAGLPDADATVGVFVATIVDGDERPVPGTRLCLYRHESGHRDCFLTAPDSGQVLVRAPRGKYTLEIRSDAHPWQVLGERPLEAGERIDLGTIHLSPPAFVRGEIFGGDSATLDSLKLRWTDDGRRRVGTGERHARAYRSPPLGAGTYELVVQGDLVERVELRVGVERGVDQVQSVSLVPAAMRRVRFEMPPDRLGPDVVAYEVRDAADRCVWSDRRDVSRGAPLEVRISARPGDYRLRASTDAGLAADVVLRIDGDGSAEPQVVRLSQY